MRGARRGPSGFSDGERREAVILECDRAGVGARIGLPLFGRQVERKAVIRPFVRHGDRSAAERKFVHLLLFVEVGGPGVVGTPGAGCGGVREGVGTLGERQFVASARGGVKVAVEGMAGERNGIRISVLVGQHVLVSDQDVEIMDGIAVVVLRHAVIGGQDRMGEGQIFGVHIDLLLLRRGEGFFQQRCAVAALIDSDHVMDVFGFRIEIGPFGGLCELRHARRGDEQLLQQRVFPALGQQAVDHAFGQGLFDDVAQSLIGRVADGHFGGLQVENFDADGQPVVRRIGRAGVDELIVSDIIAARVGSAGHHLIGHARHHVVRLAVGPQIQVVQGVVQRTGARHAVDREQQLNSLGVLLLRLRSVSEVFDHLFQQRHMAEGRFRLHLDVVGDEILARVGEGEQVVVGGRSGRKSERDDVAD